ncbi:MAG TPA: hypothetical protein PKE32_06660 [Miltoncostaeaceae bacterium]|nr:hypothetical protein [Miltoncostaeaceae bacterium]
MAERPRGRGLDTLNGGVVRRSRTVPEPPRRPVPMAQDAPAALAEVASAVEPAPTAVAPAPASVPLTTRQPLHRLTVDIRGDLEERLSDVLHLMRKSLARPATRVELIELLLAGLPTDRAGARELARQIDRRRREDPR